MQGKQTIVRYKGSEDGYAIRLDLGPVKFLAVRAWLDEHYFWSIYSRTRKGRRQWRTADVENARTVRALLPSIAVPVTPN